MESVVGGGESGVGLHAVFADVQAFGLFLFGDADATEEGADDLPGDEAGHHGPNGIGSSTQSLDAELVDAAADQKAEAGAIALDVVAPETCLLYTSPSPRDLSTSRMPSSA